jgi:hypothetical protein
LKVGILEGEEYELSSQGPALAAAARAAVGGVPRLACEEFPLTWIWNPFNKN